MGSDRPDRVWAFNGQAARPRPGESEEFARRLIERLRVGQAIGASFEIVWRSGPRPSLEVRPGDGSTERWWREGVVPTYPALSWRRTEPPAPGPAHRWTGRPTADGSAPFRSGGDPPWSDGVLPPLRSFPEGGTVRWRIRGAGRVEHAPVLAGSEGVALVPSGLRSILPVPTPRRSVEDLRELRRLEPRWHVRVEVTTPVRAPLGEGERLARSIGAVSRLTGGNGVAFVRSSWVGSLASTDMSWSSDELLGTLPSAWSGWFGPAERLPEGTRRWTLGVDELGRPISVPVEPRNGRHLLVVGESGMGKSTLLVRIALRAAELGTVVLLDPLGETGRDVLVRLPPDRRPAPTWIAPLDAPIGLNALDPAHAGPAGRERAVADLVAALRRVRSARFEAAPFWGPRLEEATHWALTAAAGVPGGSLVDAESFLGDPDSVRDPPRSADAALALRLLRERAHDRPDELEGARRMLAEVSRSTVLRSLLSEANARWTAPEAFRPRAVTVVTGDAAVVGASGARALLALYLALLAGAAMAGANASPVFLVLEEASWYAHESLAELLRLGRRYGLHVVVAAQSLDAFPEDLREALWTNASDQIRFRGSPTEARSLERWDAELTTERLVGLPRGVAAALLGKGRDLRWIVTTPSEPPPDAGERLDRIAAESRRRWGPTSTTPPGRATDPPPAPREPPGPPLESRLWREIDRRCSGVDGVVRLPVADLRSSTGATDADVRAAGRVVRSEEFARTEHRSDGTVWVIDTPRYRQWRGARSSSGDEGPEPRGPAIGEPSTRP